MKRPLDALMGLAARRPAPVLAVVVVLALVGAVLATRLDVSAGTDTLVGDGSDVYAATERWREAFGDDAVFVMVRGDVADTFLGEDLGRVIGLEGCISGNVPEGAQPPGGPGGPCATMAADRPVRAVYGPGTFINEAAFQLRSQFQTQLQASREQAAAAAQEASEQAREEGASEAEAQQAGEAAAGQVQAQFQQQVFGLAARYGIRGIPSASDPQFVSQLICDTSQPLCAPKERFSYLFPNAQGGADTAIIQVRLDPGLSDEQQARTIETIRAAVGMEDWRLGTGGQYLVTGAPVVVADLTDAITGSIIVLLIAAGLVMAATLALVLSHTAAPGAAGHRPRCRGADLRCAVAGRRPADHGVHRRAAGAHRPGRGLRDPDPVACGGGPGRPSPALRGCRLVQRRLRGGAHRGHRRGSHRGRLPRAAALARPHGAGLRCAAGGGHRGGPPAHPDRGHRRPGDRP